MACTNSIHSFYLRRRFLVWMWIACFSAVCVLVSRPSAADEPPWLEEFQRLCSYTEVANTLEQPQLEKLIQDCDRFLANLETVDDRRKKTYIFRIKKCRDLFKYILDLRAAQTATPRSTGQE